VRIEVQFEIRLPVAELQQPLGILLDRSADLFDDPPFARIQRLAGRIALRLDEDLAGAVSAQHGPVLDQGRAAAHPRRGHRGERAGQAAADHHRVEFLQPPHLAAGRAQQAAGLGQLLAVAGRLIGQVAGQQDRVAAAVMAGQIVQAKLDGAGRQVARAAVFPDPARGLALAEDVLRRLAAQEHLEAARAELRQPIAAANPEAIDAGRRDADLGDGIFHRPVQANRQQHRRAYLVHELRVVGPASQVAKQLRLAPHGRGPVGRARGNSRDRQ
jgi:hypothetical protein